MKYRRWHIIRCLRLCLRCRFFSWILCAPFSIHSFANFESSSFFFPFFCFLSFSIFLCVVILYACCVDCIYCMCVCTCACLFLSSTYVISNQFFRKRGGGGESAYHTLVAVVLTPLPLRYRIRSTFGNTRKSQPPYGRRVGRRAQEKKKKIAKRRKDGSSNQFIDMTATAGAIPLLSSDPPSPL